MSHQIKCHTSKDNIFHSLGKNVCSILFTAILNGINWIFKHRMNYLRHNVAVYPYSLNQADSKFEFILLKIATKRNFGTSCDL